MTQKRKLTYNTISSIVFQITTIICGFIVPRLILGHFGSEVNGLVNSITQFLQLIAFLELGVGAVVQSSMYKPLVDGDTETLSKIVKSANRFFRIIACALLSYVIVLILIFPRLIDNKFDALYTGTLIAAISISFFSQYYFGVVDRLLLTADQHGYIQYNAQTITLLINTLFCAILISIGCSIQVVKLTTSLVYLIRPLYLHFYVEKHYSLNKHAQYDEEPITQKWNGIAQHIAAIVLDCTDNIVLTLFSTLANVSIYSVYFLVVNGIKQLFTSLIVGAQALLGELWAKGDNGQITHFFSWVEWTVHTAATVIWGCTFSLIVPFVSIYTLGVNDANYIVPTFAALITIANMVHSMRMPYNILILAAGHYKETQSNYIIAAIINLGVSIIMVSIKGLIGVAIGTLVAMAFQTSWMAWYDSNKLLHRKITVFIKQMMVDCCAFILGVTVTKFIHLGAYTWRSWLLLAMADAAVWVAMVTIVNMFFYRERMLYLFNKFVK